MTATTETHNAIPDGLMALNLTCGAITTRRHVRDGEMNGIIEADKKDDARGVVDGRKEVLRSPLIARIKAAQQALANSVRALTVPTGDALFKKGVYVIKAEAIPLVEAEVAKRHEEISGLLAEVEASYSTMREEAQARLEKIGMWRAAQFPTLDDIRYGSRIETSYVGITVPEALAEISADLFEREKQKAAQAWEDAKTESLRALREEMAGLVEHLRDRLTPDSDGKEKVFRNSLLDNLTEFCQSFPLRDVAGDSALADVVTRLQALKGMDPDAIRSSTRVRETLSATMAEVKQIADGLVANAPIRRFRF